jgi:hypothetical protein
MPPINAFLYAKNSLMADVHLEANTIHMFKVLSFPL